MQRTVGLMPRETRAARTTELKAIADFRARVEGGCRRHPLGFVPHDKSDPEYREMLEITRDICDHCKRNGQALHLETGQEPVDVLIEFLDDVERDNMFVNFDPANMILYGAGEPIPALEKLGSRVHSIHCKDATWSESRAKPGAARCRSAKATSIWPRSSRR